MPDEEKWIDLHTHSTASDGSDTPSELAEKMCASGLAAGALTDHDTVSGLEEFLRASEEKGFFGIPGVELSTRLRGKEIHIVGLFIDFTSGALVKFLQARREERLRRNTEMIRKLRENGYEITEEEVNAEAGGESVGRPHMARVLLAKGYFSEMRDVFSRCLGRNAPCYVPRASVTPEEAIRIILASGGLAVWAHPILSASTRSAMRRVLRELVPAGLSGLETRYSLYGESDRAAAKTVAAEFGLLESGGSDYHGGNQPGIELGRKLEIPYGDLEKMLKKLVRS